MANYRISTNPVRELAEARGITSPSALATAAGIDNSTARKYWFDDASLSRFVEGVLIALVEAFELDGIGGQLFAIDGDHIDVLVQDLARAKGIESSNELSREASLSPNATKRWWHNDRSLRWYDANVILALVKALEIEDLGHLLRLESIE